MRKLFTVIALLMAVLLTSCAQRYDIEEMKIGDPIAYFGWKTRLLNGYREELEDYRFLEVTYGGVSMKQREMDQKITYLVFESSSEARGYFRKWKKYCINKDDGEKRVGTNWFIARQPDTYDMIATAMYYCERNVIIEADVSLTFYSTENGGTSSTAIDRTEGDKMKTYILENHAELREKVMEMLES